MMNRSKYPSTLQIEVTENCNHNCFYCYNHWRTDDPSKNKMSVEDAKKLTFILDEEVRPFGVTITGGEPMMNLPAVLEIAKGNIKRGFSLNSNLTMLGEEKLNSLLETNSNFGILASLPHFESEKFENIVGVKTLPKFYENLKRITENGIKVTVNMVTNKLSKDSVYEQGKFLYEEFGIDSFAATPALKPSMRKMNGKDDYCLSNEEVAKSLDDLLRLKKDFGMDVRVLEVIPPCSLPEHLRGKFDNSCTAGRSTIQIGYDGNVRSCGRSPYSEGNIFKEDFSEIWERLDSYKLNKYIPDDCKECAEVYVCLGGCRFEDMQEGDLMNKKDSRMTTPLENRVKREIIGQVNEKTEYVIGLNSTRKEEEGHSIYYAGKTLRVNQEMKNFIMEKRNGFRIADFPEEYREKASSVAEMLMKGGFLYDKK
ncbi:radical SAM protein [Candidatus Pacearchaeota archaeon]|nr:radical SAM protein [Candidatus Pacearchaeota archaeon]